MKDRLSSLLTWPIKKFRWRVESFVAHLIDGDGLWGTARLAGALGAIALFVAFGRLTEGLTASPWVDQISQSAVPMMKPILRFAAGFFTREVLRHVLLPAAGFWLALRIGAAFVNDLFELGNASLAGEYLAASLFGQNYPRLEIKDGKAEGGADHPLIKIGGPGLVSLGVGMAAVFEHIAGPSSILGPGQHFIRRFESLREIFDLRDQYRTVPEIKAMTKDGIPVLVKDVQMSFRLRTGRPRTESESFPYSIAALRQATYNRTVGPSGTPAWADSVSGAVAGQIRAMIGQRRLDDLIGLEPEPESDLDSPGDEANPKSKGLKSKGTRHPSPATRHAPLREDSGLIKLEAQSGASRRDSLEEKKPPPRDAMHAEFRSPATRKKFAGLGAEILWVTLGHFETPSQVATQRIRTWSAFWQNWVNLSEADAQAERHRRREHVRGERLVEMINTMNTRPERQTDPDAARDLYFVELADTLEAYTRAGAAVGQAQFDEILRQTRRWRRADATGEAEAESATGKE